MNVALIITTYNRPVYLKRCLDSVARADLSSINTIMIVDDHSTDPKTIALINDFNISNNRVELIKAFSKERRSVKGSLLFGLDILFKNNDIVINLDGDAIVNKNFATRLLETKKSLPDNIITGFNCLTKNLDGSERHKVISAGVGINLKKSVGGLNMLFDRSQYQKWVRPTLVKCLEQGGNWDDHTCRASMADGFSIICLTPSCVQHIGIESSMGHSTGGEPPDVADDFVDDNISIVEKRINTIKASGGKGKFIDVALLREKLYLPNVTLVGADCVDVNRLLRAADISCKEIEFGAVKILSSLPSKDKRVIPIRHLASKGDYSTFMMKELVDFIDTDYLLVIQYDGFVLNASAWRDEWFNWDYIGAEWSWYTDNMKVGNGGFSFRSRRLHQILKDDNDIIPINEPGVTKHMEEDHCICRLYYQLLKYRHRINYAPVEEARKFSIEGWRMTNPTWNGEFGFHGHSVDITKSNQTI